MLLSYSATKMLVCPRRFKLYQQFKIGTVPTPELEYGSNRHEQFEEIVLRGALNETDEFEGSLKKLIEQYTKIEVEKYIKNEEIGIHGIIDILLQNDDKTAIIELKTGAWDIEQLEFYQVLVPGSDIYLVNLTKRTIEKIPVNYEEALAKVKATVEKARKIFETNLDELSIRPGIHCSSCLFAKACPASLQMDIVTPDNLPKAVETLNVLKARIKLLEKMIQEIMRQHNLDEIETEHYRAYFNETEYYRLGTLVKKEEVIQRLLQDGKINLLKFDNQKVAMFYPWWFIKRKKKTFKIEDKKEGSDK